MAAKLKITRPSTAEIYKRYRGPWTVQFSVYDPITDKIRCRWSPLRFIRGIDVDTYCKQMVLEEEHYLDASVFDNRFGMFITTYTKKELERIQQEKFGGA